MVSTQQLTVSSKTQIPTKSFGCVTSSSMSALFLTYTLRMASPGPLVTLRHSKSPVNSRCLFLLWMNKKSFQNLLANFPSCYIAQTCIICPFLKQSVAQEWYYHDWLKDALGICSTANYPNKIKILLKEGREARIDGEPSTIEFNVIQSKKFPSCGVLRSLNSTTINTVAHKQKPGSFTYYVSWTLFPQSYCLNSSTHFFPAIVTIIFLTIHLPLVFHFPPIHLPLCWGWGFSRGLSGYSHGNSNAKNGVRCHFHCLLPLHVLVKYALWLTGVWKSSCASMFKRQEEMGWHLLLSSA